MIHCCHHINPRTEKYWLSVLLLIITSHLNGNGYCGIWVKFRIRMLKIYKISIFPCLVTLLESHIVQQNSSTARGFSHFLKFYCGIYVLLIKIRLGMYALLFGSVMRD